MADETPTETPTLSAIPSAIASATVSAAATPQSLPPMDPEERTNSLQVSLADLTAKANALYAQKKFEEAAEIFSQATEMQAEINGEMAPENADVLFLYGRSLFKVGQSKSDVLGGKAAGENKSNGAADKKSKAKKPQAESSAANAAEDVTEGVANTAAKNATDDGKIPDAKKPLFSFTGDENFEDSEEEEEAEGEEDEDEEDDDLAVAFEILDLARLLFEKSLEQEDQDSSEGKGKEKAEGDSPIIKHIKERLADTHDLLAEISLENEKYPLAINDCRASLKYKEELYGEESEVIAEAHFKLSLALEFASVTTTEEGAGGANAKPVDEDLRAEAAVELEKAIKSTKLKLDAKEVDLAMMHAPEDNEATRKQIAEVKDLIADMEQRLVDLRKPPMDVNSVLASDDTMLGVLGAALGESNEKKEARIEEAKKNAKDVSGLVRKKTKEEPKQEINGNGKRKAEDDAPGDEEAKKAKVEETAQA
ncbi:hypothetical protein F5B19DRAFT_411564 [Rostrohypoxylon terebratum]|nr:hypothetical protein F5B19DRAFT_411564 [Rostrohypoxylon terebratum]